MVIPRTIAQEPRIRVLGGLTTQLEFLHRSLVLEPIRGLDTVVAATLHEIELAPRFCDLMALLSAGEILTQEPPSSVLAAAAIQDVEAKVDTQPAMGELTTELQPRRQDHGR